MTHLNSFKSIKKNIKEKAILRLSFDQNYFGETPLKKFLDDFFNVYNISEKTFYENGTTQTKKNTRRTISDIYRIVLYYYPNSKLSQVYKFLMELISEDRIGSAICEKLKKRVYRGTVNEIYNTDGFFNSSPIDEYGINFTLFESYNNCNINTGPWGEEYTEEDLKMINL